MNLFELFIKIGVDDNGFKKGINGAKDNFGKFSAWTVAKGQLIADGIKAGGKALIDFGKQAINSYAEYEQLVGGVQTLFGLQGQSLEEYAATVGKTTDEALDEWLKYTTGERKILNASEEAYKTAGMSANEYMQTVTGFSAALIQGLGGDTAKAADMANLAVTDMADNANKMGTSMELIQNAYQGFAKDNFTINLVSAA